MAKKKLEFVYKGTEVDGVWYPADPPLIFTEVPGNICDYLPEAVNQAIADAFAANFEMHEKSKQAG
jgi:hypothetical protein